jgi:hypothetical protein
MIAMIADGTTGASGHGRGCDRVDRHRCRDPRPLPQQPVNLIYLPTHNINPNEACQQSGSISLGYVSARIMESVFAAIGIMSIISIVNVADAWAPTGADSSALAVTCPLRPPVRRCE